MPYGFRVVRAALVGFILFAIAAGFAWPIGQSIQALHPSLQPDFLFAGFAPAVFVLGGIVECVEPIMFMIIRISNSWAAMFPKTKIGRIAATYPLFIVFTVSMLLSMYVLFNNFGGVLNDSSLTINERFMQSGKGALVYGQAMLPLAIWLVPIWFVTAIDKAKSGRSVRQWFFQGRGRMARFAGPSHYRDHARPVMGNWASDPARTSIYLGRTLFSDTFGPMDISIRDDGHMLTIGQPGSGKSVTAIWPNLAMFNSSVIVIDPKGEHAKMFVGRRQSKGYFTCSQEELTVYEKDYERDPTEENLNNLNRQRTDTAGRGTNTNGISSVSTPLEVHAYLNKKETRKERHRSYVLDPFGVNGKYPSSNYNPLSEIDIKSDNARKLISAVSGSCIVPSKGENRFWEEAARAVLDGAIAHVLSRFPRGQQTLPVIADLLMGCDPETGFADPEKFDELLIDMRMNDAAGGLPKIGASTLDDLGDRARGSVIAELRTAMKWATDPAMRKHLSSSAFRFDNMGIHHMTVFVSLPFGHMTEQARWLRTITEVSLRILEDRTNKKRPILYVLDELPQYGSQLKAIKEGMVTLRSANVKLWAFVQNIRQLNDCFGDDGAKNFESGGVVQVFGVSDGETAEWVARKLGQQRIADRKGILRRKIQGHREVDLVPREEVEQVLGKAEDIQYVFRSGSPPMRLLLIAYKPMSFGGRKFKGLPLAGYYDEH
jgi:type IV secretory pathway TraG/TraD family ATPase VirD4